MKEIRYTLVSEGSSDCVLLPILSWLLRQHTTGYAIQPVWAELRRLPRPPQGLAERIQMGLDLYPCDLLFVHRDADRTSYDIRATEIQQALSQVAQWDIQRSIYVIPVRMTEAWLLIDESALRRAAGNSNGHQELEIPPINRLEDQPDPKQALHQLLKDASGLQGRRLKHFPIRESVLRITEFISDFAPLRGLVAFRELERHVCQVVHEQGWACGDT